MVAEQAWQHYCLPVHLPPVLALWLRLGVLSRRKPPIPSRVKRSAAPGPGGGIFINPGETMSIGTIKWFNAQKGYGFIQPEAGGNDVFVHISALERSGLGSLNEGQKVKYEVERDQRSGKMSATNL